MSENLHPGHAKLREILDTDARRKLVCEFVTMYCEGVLSRQTVKSVLDKEHSFLITDASAQLIVDFIAQI